MQDSSQFERDKVCYEQNCQQLRHLNQIMWQVPTIAMTVTGALWYAVSATQFDHRLKAGILVFAALANIGLILNLFRIRYVLEQYLVKIKVFNDHAFADASRHRWPWMRNRSVVNIFGVLMGLAALLSILGALIVAYF